MVTATEVRSPSRTQARVANLELSLDERQLFAAGRRVELSAREFAILAFLVQRELHVSFRQEIYEAVSGSPMPAGNRTVDVHISRIRRKLAEAAPDWTYIHTHFQLGYRFDLERQQS